jgi:hypothetical protein
MELKFTCKQVWSKENILLSSISNVNLFNMKKIWQRKKILIKLLSKLNQGLRQILSYWLIHYRGNEWEKRRKDDETRPVPVETFGSSVSFANECSNFVQNFGTHISIIFVIQWPFKCRSTDYRRMVINAVWNPSMCYLSIVSTLHKKIGINIQMNK